MAGYVVEIAFDLVAGINQQHAAARGGRQQGMRQIKPVLVMTFGLVSPQGQAQRLMLCGMQFGQMQPVLRAQHGAGNQRRAGVAVRAVGRTDAGKCGAVGVVICKEPGGAGDTTRGLTGAGCSLAAQVIERASGVGLNVAERFVLGRQIGQNPGQKPVLVHVREIARVIHMLVAEHPPDMPLMERARNTPRANGAPGRAGDPKILKRRGKPASVSRR